MKRDAYFFYKILMGIFKFITFNFDAESYKKFNVNFVKWFNRQSLLPLVSFLQDRLHHIMLG